MNTFCIIYDDAPIPIRGIALPVFDNSSACTLRTLDIYEDGVIQAGLDMIPIADLHNKIAAGEIDTELPEGVRLLINGLGSARATNAQWFITRHEIMSQVQELFSQLNPDGKEMQNIQATVSSSAGIQLQLRRFHSLARDLYRLTPDGQEIRGAKVPIFYIQNEETQLTDCFVYQDKQAQIGYQGALFPIEIIHEMLNDGQLSTVLLENQWVTIPGLGRFQATKAEWPIDPQERWREILNLVAYLNGQGDIVQLCFEAFKAYQTNPDTVHRENLRTLYESVPKHLRWYTQQDMDRDDYDIRQILGLSLD